MFFDRRSAMVEEAVPLLLLDKLQTLTQLQHRAENLGAELATLKQQITRDLLGAIADDRSPQDRSGQEAILVAEDHPTLGAIAGEILEGLGYQVFFTDSGLSDVPILAKYDAILLDVPLLNAENLARVERARQWSPQIWVSTSLPEGPARQRLRDAGVVGFVSKPLQPREVERCLRKRSFV
jgi:CheY-like chemotaxis protein